MSDRVLTDPAVYERRACKQVPTDVFFPPATRPRLVRRAQEICQACPVRRLCAAYALPLVESRQFTAGVVAGVYVPAGYIHAPYQARLNEAVNRLRDIAEGREAEDTVSSETAERGAAWTAA